MKKETKEAIGKKKKKDNLYNFSIKDMPEESMCAVILEDDTHLVFGDKTLTFLYPKTKFIKIFEKQIKDKGKKYIGVAYTRIEVEAIMKGLSMIVKKREKENGKI